MVGKFSHLGVTVKVTWEFDGLWAVGEWYVAGRFLLHN